MTMDDKMLKEIRAREQAATPGPWFCHESHNWHKDPPKEYFVITRGARDVVASWVEPADAQFIAHAREDVPDLLDEIVRLKAENEALRESLDMAKNDILDAAITPCSYCKDNPIHGGSCNMRNDEHEMFACWSWQFDEARFAGGDEG